MKFLLYVMSTPHQFAQIKQFTMKMKLGNIFETESAMVKVNSTMKIGN